MEFNDGFPDLVVQGFGANAVSVFLNKGMLDIGLRVQEEEGAAPTRIGVMEGGPSPVKIRKNGKTYDVILVDPASPKASIVRMRVKGENKALKKF